jgi:hypothetical protein
LRLCKVRYDNTLRYGDNTGVDPMYAVVDMTMLPCIKIIQEYDNYPSNGNNAVVAMIMLPGMETMRWYI